MTIKKISELPDYLNASITGDDSLPIIDSSLGITKKIRVSELDQRYSTNSASETTARENADSALSARISPIEDIFEFEKTHIYENNTQAYADAKAPEADLALRDGWYFKNTMAGQKINWYFFDGLNLPSITLGDFSAYAVMTFDSVKSPILAVYTMPTGTNDVISGFAHSKSVYSGFDITPVTGKKYLVYFGQNPAIHPELPRLQLAKSTISSAGDQNLSERVLTVSFGSNSSDVTNTVQFMVESLGVNSPSLKFEAELRIRKASVKALADSIAVQKSYVDSQDISILSSAQSYADQKVADLISSAPATLDTLNELAATLGNDANFSATVLGRISSVDDKIDQEIIDRQAFDITTLNDAKAYTDTQIASLGSDSNFETTTIFSLENRLRVDTDSQGLTSTQKTNAKTNIDLNNVSNTSDTDKPVSTATQTALNLKANLSSPDFTGTPTAPTAVSGTNTTQIATTAFVTSAISGLGQAQSPNQAPTETSFAILNNQTSAADITGLVYSPSSYVGFEIVFAVVRSTATQKVVSVERFSAAFNSLSQSWLSSQTYAGNDSGVILSVTAAGQVQYVTSSLSGSGYSGTIKYVSSVAFSV